MLAGRTHSRLVPPMNLPAFLRSTPLDLPILLFQPFGHSLGILLVGLPHGFLGCESPAPQILAHSANRQANADLLLDQILNRLTGPQHEAISNSSDSWSRSTLGSVAPVPRQGGDRSRSDARCDHRVKPPGPLGHNANTTGRRFPHEPPGSQRYRRRRNPTPAHAPHATSRRRGRHWTQNVHRVTRWPSDDPLLPSIPLHAEHRVAPLPVTIKTSPETTRSSCSLTNFFAGLKSAQLPRRWSRISIVTWPGKRDVTFSDAITAVRRWWWVEWVFAHFPVIASPTKNSRPDSVESCSTPWPRRLEPRDRRLATQESQPQTPQQAFSRSQCARKRRLLEMAKVKLSPSTLVRATRIRGNCGRDVRDVGSDYPDKPVVDVISRPQELHLRLGQYSERWSGEEPLLTEPRGPDLEQGAAGIQDRQFQGRRARCRW